MGMFIYNMLKYVSSAASTICIVSTIYYVYLLFYEKYSFNYWMEEIKNGVYSFAGNRTKGILVIALLATAITNTALHQLVGIHNLHLKPEGTYCFFVEARRYGGNTYTLPAQIRIEKGKEEISDEKTKTNTYYYVEKVYFSNGGWLDTRDNEPVEIGESSYHYDYDADGEWELVLLNEHAYSPYITETNNADWLGVTFLLIEVLPISFLLYALCRREKSDNQ